MAFGDETRQGFPDYTMETENSLHDVKFTFSIEPGSIDGGDVTEDARDAAFQEFLTAVAALPNTTITSATKTGRFTIPVTA